MYTPPAKPLLSFSQAPVSVLSYMTFTFLFGACNVIYHPTMQNVPMFNGKKDEFHGNVGLQNAQISYSPTSRLGTMVNGYYRYGVYNGYSVDGAVGAHWDGGELFGGFGIGKSSRSSLFTNDKSWSGRTDFHRFYFQPDFSFGSFKHRFAFSTRFEVVRFYNVVQEYGMPTHGIVAGFAEPAFTWRIRGKNNSCILQLQYVGVLTKPHDAFNYDFLYRDLLKFSFAFHIPFSRSGDTPTAP